MSSLFTWFNKEHFFLGFSLSEFTCSLQKYPDKSFTRALNVLHTFATKFPIGTIRIFCFYPLSCPDFYPDSYGINIRFTSAKCKREVYLDKTLPDFVPLIFIFTGAQIKIDMLSGSSDRTLGQSPFYFVDPGTYFVSMSSSVRKTIETFFGLGNSKESFKYGVHAMVI